MNEINDKDYKYNKSDIDIVINHWKSELKNYVLYDYADMIGAPTAYRGQKFCYGDPEPIIIEETISMLEDLKIVNNFDCRDIKHILEKFENTLEHNIRFTVSPLHTQAVSNFILDEDETKMLINIMKEYIKLHEIK